MEKIVSNLKMWAKKVLSLPGFEPQTTMVKLRNSTAAGSLCIDEVVVTSLFICSFPNHTAITRSLGHGRHVDRPHPPTCRPGHLAADARSTGSRGHNPAAYPHRQNHQKYIMHRWGLEHCLYSYRRTAYHYASSVVFRVYYTVFH